MKDPRLEKLAHLLVNYSVRVQPGENILINAKGEVPDLVQALVSEI